MKNLLLILLGSFFLTISACSKCGHCEMNGTTISGKVCKKDNASAYDASKSGCISPAVWVEE